MKDLFGIDITLPAGAPEQKGIRKAMKQYRQLIAIYGKVADKQCRSCSFCFRHQAGSKKFYKCHKANVGGPATDWNSRWVACGLFQQYIKPQ